MDLEVVCCLLREQGLATSRNPDANPTHASIITSKDGMKGLKLGPVGENDSSSEARMAKNVVCK